MCGRFLKGEGKAFPSLQPCPSVTLERSDRVQGKSSATPSAGTPRNAPYNNARSAGAARAKKGQSVATSLPLRFTIAKID